MRTASPPADAPGILEGETPVKKRRGWQVALVTGLYRALFASLRVSWQNADQLRGRAEGGPLIFVFWHNRLLLFPMLWHRHFQCGRPTGVAMISASRDGEIISSFLARFGLMAARGSANRRGAGALRELAGWLRRGHDVGITPDGSKGPCYELKPGLVLLAQLSGRPLQPVGLEFSSCWRLKSWDRFFIPRPFSRITVTLGEPLLVVRTSSPEEFEAERLRCELAMLAQVVQR